MSTTPDSARPKKVNRRDLFRSAGAASAAALLAAAGARPLDAAPARDAAPNVYSTLGARPFINCTATLTINGGSRLLPEVIDAIEHASHYHVNLDDLQEAAGRRLSELLQVEWGVVTSGAAGALAYASAGIVAGTDPERMQQLPDLTGLKSEAIMPRSSRNQYDHAVRMVGLKTVEVDSAEELKAAINEHTALVMVLGNRFDKVRLGLAEVAPIAKAAGIPILVDAAPDYLIVPNPYIALGADLVAMSGGKILRGPQTAGLLLGKEKLVRAAFANAAPHHAFGRPMKVSKEEIVGMVTAVEVFVQKRNLDKEFAEWKGWYDHISKKVTTVPGVTTKVLEPSRGGPFPTLQVSWDPKRTGLTGADVHEQLLNGEPSIETHASGDSHAFVIRPVAMNPGEYQIVADRLLAVLQSAPGPKEKKVAAPAGDVSGRWDVEVRFLSGESKHVLFLEAEGNRVEGTHLGTLKRGPVKGKVDGDKVSLDSVLAIEGSRLSYRFDGTLKGDRIEGDLHLGEYPKATFTARRHAYGGPVSEDPSKAGKTA